jgi:hypothetical protein
MLNRLANIYRAMRQLPQLLFPALVIASSAATAQGYPNRPIHIIVPYAAGGAIDSTARILAERLGPSLRQTLIIENKPGAAGRSPPSLCRERSQMATQFSIRLVLT